MKTLVLVCTIALVGCAKKPPPAVFKASGTHVFVSPDGLGDVDPSCAGKVPALDPATNIAQSLGVGFARAGFRSVLTPEDDILTIEPTIHVRACRVDSASTLASGDLILAVSKSGHPVDRVVMDVGMQPVDTWVKDAVSYVLASKLIAAAVGR